MTVSTILIKDIGPPKWPWDVDANLAAKGQAVYQRPPDQGGCAVCHDVTAGKPRSLFRETWATPIQNVTTDTHQYDILIRSVKTGSLEDAIDFGVKPPRSLMVSEKAFDVLTTSVIGSIIDHTLNIGGEGALVESRIQGTSRSALPPSQMKGQLSSPLEELQSQFHSPSANPATSENGSLNLQPQPQVQSDIQSSAPPKGQTWSTTISPPQRGYYEARVLKGIWAAAPYLHNGSVPTLAELLKPAAERVKSFKVGPAYDTVNIGLAAEQTQFSSEIVTTDCSELNSGNSRCGHEFGTQLTPDEKNALLEYLKTL